MVWKLPGLVTHVLLTCSHNNTVSHHFQTEMIPFYRWQTEAESQPFVQKQKVRSWNSNLQVLDTRLLNAGAKAESLRYFPCLGYGLNGVCYLIFTQHEGIYQVIPTLQIYFHFVSVSLSWCYYTNNPQSLFQKHNSGSSWRGDGCIKQVLKSVTYICPECLLQSPLPQSKGHFADAAKGAGSSPSASSISRLYLGILKGKSMCWSCDSCSHRLANQKGNARKHWQVCQP